MKLLRTSAHGRWPFVEKTRHTAPFDQTDQQRCNGSRHKRHLKTCVLNIRHLKEILKDVGSGRGGGKVLHLYDYLEVVRH